MATRISFRLGTHVALSMLMTTLTSCFPKGLVFERSHSAVVQESVSENAPLITRQPSNQYVKYGEKATLLLQHRANAEVSIQWYFNDSPIPGATKKQLNIDSLKPWQTGSYYAKLSSPAFNEISTKVEVNNLQAPYLIESPSSKINILAGQLLVIDTVVRGGTDNKFSWRKNTTEQADSSQSRYIEGNVRFNANYHLKVSNLSGEFVKDFEVEVSPANTSISNTPAVTLIASMNPFANQQFASASPLVWRDTNLATDQIEIPYAFLKSGERLTIPNGVNGQAGNFEPVPTSFRRQIHKILYQWEKTSNIRFIEVADQNQALLTFVTDAIAPLADGSTYLAYTCFPNNGRNLANDNGCGFSNKKANVVLNRQALDLEKDSYSSQDPEPGTILHELGHSLFGFTDMCNTINASGICSSLYDQIGVNQYRVLDSDVGTGSTLYTIMSYERNTDHSSELDYSVFPQEPMYMDIAAAHIAYGAPTAKQRPVNSKWIYDFQKPLLATLYSNQSNFDIDLSAATTNLYVDIRDSSFGNTAAEDRLYWSSAGSSLGKNFFSKKNFILYKDSIVSSIVTGSGNDLIIANAHSAFLMGGKGDDKYMIADDVGEAVIVEMQDSGIDTLFLTDRSFESVGSSAEGSDLVLEFGENKLRIANYYLWDTVEKIVDREDKEFLLTDEFPK